MRSSLHWAEAACAATLASYNLPPRRPEWPGTLPPPGAKGWGGKDMMVVEEADVGTERAETEGLLILAPYPKIDKNEDGHKCNNKRC